jgi:cysteine desulfurase
MGKIRKMKSIYLDYAATTPMNHRVLESMLPFFDVQFGNPSSSHYFGQKGEGAVEDSRVSVSLAMNSKPGNIIFTSGGTESDNLAIRGMSLFARKFKGANRILTTPVEHPAVANTVRQLQELFGFEVDYLPVDFLGLVNPDDVRRMIKKDTALVSVIYANNEIGTINPIKEIGAVCSSLGVPLHTDAVQAAAHLKIDTENENIDLMTIGAHKFYGPKGVGALIKRAGIQFIPTQTGGSQEQGLRAGTHNVPYIFGLAKALELAQKSFQKTESRLTELREYLIGLILEQIPQVKLTGHPTQRLSNHASFIFQGIDGNQLVIVLDRAGFACSSGSACKTGNPKPSEVLKAIGVPDDWALGSLRVTLGNQTTKEELDSFVASLVEIVHRLRETRL